MTKNARNGPRTHEPVKSVSTANDDKSKPRKLPNVTLVIIRTINLHRLVGAVQAHDEGLRLPLSMVLSRDRPCKVKDKRKTALHSIPTSPNHGLRRSGSSTSLPYSNAGLGLGAPRPRTALWARGT